MRRSVSYPRDCIAVCFRDVSDIEGPEDWHDYVDQLRDSAIEAWPSLSVADTWLDREDRAITANVFAYIGVSEYCGLAAIWLKSRANDAYTGFCGSNMAHEALANHWCAHIAKRFTGLFGDYELVARASNGEAFYRKIEVRERVMTRYHETLLGWRQSPVQLPLADFAAWRIPASHQQTCIQGAIRCFTDITSSQAGGGSPVLFHRGYKWIKFKDFGTLKIYRKKADELHRLKPCNLKPKPVARKLQAKQKLYRKLGLGLPKRALQQAIDGLRNL